MNTNDTIQMMKRCSQEIKDLRAQIDHLRPKADAYDSMTTLIRVMAPNQSYGMSEDLARRLDREVASMEEAAKAPATTD